MGSSKPVILAVDDDPKSLELLRSELGRRYDGDYRIRACGSSADAAAALDGLRSGNDEVALALIDARVAESQDTGLLERIRSQHPQAKRATLIDWGAWGHRPTADALLHAVATGRIDFYVLKPAGAGDEQFHRFVAEMLHEWSRDNSPIAHELSMVGDPSERRTHELRDLLKRSGVAFGFEVAEGSKPILRMRDGRTLRDPTNEEVVEAFGVERERPGR